MCEGAVLEEVKGCNEVACDAPTDCVVGAWGSWSTCDATCGGGQKKRLRAVTPPTFGGNSGSAVLIDFCFMSTFYWNLGSGKILLEE